MSRLRKLVNEWFLPQNLAGPGSGRDRRLGKPKTRRPAPRKNPSLESVEDRILLSTVDVTGVKSSPALEIQAAKQPVQISGVSGTGLQGSAATVRAMLTTNGTPMFNRTITFQIGDRVVGRAKTDALGVATLSGVNLKRLGAGVYGQRLVASFAGTARFDSASVHGRLVVSLSTSNVTAVSGTGGFGSPASLTATLTSNGAPVAGKSLTFQVLGLAVGSATTNAQGVATLSGVNLGSLASGTYAGAVTARSSSDAQILESIGSGDLTVGKATATITLGSLSQTYNGTARLATATTSPANLPVTFTYTDSSGNVVATPINAGSYNVTATISNPNYLGSATGVLTVAQATVTASGVTANSKVYNGTTATTANTSVATLSGVIAGDAVTLNGASAVATFADKNVGTDKTVTITGLTLAGASAANYVLVPSTITTTASITAATLTATGITASNKVYDATTDATIDTTAAALSGVIAGDTVTLDTSAATGSFADKNVGTGKTVTISGLTIGGSGAGNYVLAATTTTADITAAALTVTGITASNKVYDGTTAATLDTTAAALTGVIAGDTVTLDASAATGTFADKNVGVGKTVTIGGLTLTGADAGNYTITPPTTTADITAATLTITGITADKVYDGSTDATLDTTNAVLGGLVTGDDVTLDTTAVVASFADKNVGTDKAVTYTGLALAGADAGNYTFTPPAVTGNITAATLTVTGITASDKVYDGSTDATIDTTAAALTGVIVGDDVTLDASTAAGAFVDKNAGADKTVTITGLAITGADAGNYVLGTTTTTASITAATLTVTGITASDKVYDGTTDATIDTTAAALTGIIGSDVVTLDTTGALGAFDDKNVGVGKTVTITGLALTGADAANYVIATTTTTASITAATLTVTGITASDKVYDGTTDATIDTTAAALNGIVTGDTVTLDATAATGTFDDKNVGTDKTVTIAGLILSGADAGNYVIATTTTTASITAATLTVTGITASDKVYDGTTDATIDTTAAALTGVIGSDVVTLDATAATGSFADKNAGTGKTVTIAGLALTGADAGNYVIATTTTTASITQATLTLTGVTASDKVYDGTTTATIDTTGAGVTGVVAGDDVTLDASAAVGAFADKNAGVGKTVDITGLVLTGADAANYVVVSAVTASITPKSVNITGITASNKVYDASTGATLDTTNAAIDPADIIAGDTVTLDVSGAVGTFADKNAGTGKTVTVTGLLLAGADAANYDFVLPITTTADITKATLTVTGITANNKAFDGNTTATLNTGGAALVGVIGSDVVTLDTSAAIGTFANAGPGTGITVFITGLTIDGTDAVNYDLTQPTTTADITP